MSKDYSDHAAKLKTLKSENADTELIKMVVSEANLADKLGTIYKSLADEVLLQSGFREMESGNTAIKEQLADIRSKHDVLRINLSRKYDTQFPTLEDTAKETESGSDDSGTKKPEGVLAPRASRTTSSRPFAPGPTARHAQGPGEISRHGRRQGETRKGRRHHRPHRAQFVERGGSAIHWRGRIGRFASQKRQVPQSLA